ncbi:MAG: hypothetical protein J6V75_02305 [Bacteroidaceae bacterium]|nr:hypothetical protein [Bacteroidaceae bacterium]
MKKKLVGYLILACSIFGLTLVGSCKDYEIETLQEEIDNLRSDVYDGTLKDTLKDIYTNLGDLKKKADDTLKARIDTLYKFLGDAIYDTLKVDSAGTQLTGVSTIINYLNRGLTDAAAVADSANDTAKWLAQELRNLRIAWSDSLKAAFDTARMSWALANQNKGELATLKTKTNQMSDSLKHAYDSLKAIRDSLKNHLTRIEALEARTDNTGVDNKDSIKNALELATRDSVKILDLIQKDKDLNKRIDSLASVTKLLSDTAKIYLDSALAYTDDLAAAVHIEIHDSLEKVRAEYKAADDAIKARLAKMSDSIKVNRIKIDSICKQVDTLKMRFDTIWDTLHAIIERLNIVELRVDTLELRVDSLMDAEKHRITSLYVQGAETPAFGMFALPVGIKSNILMTYYGEVKNASTGVNFPTIGDSRLFFKDQKFTAKESAMLAASGFNLDVDGINVSGTLYGDSAGNAGKLYFTVNPNEVDITSDPSYYTFAFKNSQGKAANVKIDTIVKSSKTLKFGFNSYGTRGAGDDPATGFYEAVVSIPEANIAEFKPNYDKSALVGIAKELKNNRDFSLTGITTSVLKTFDNVLDADALNVTWKDSLGVHNVTSGYDIAIAAITPLSYHSLPALMDEFEITKKRLPLNPIDQVLAAIKQPSVKLSFKPIKMNDVTFVIDNINYTAGTIADIHISVKDGGGTEIGSADVPMTDLNSELLKIDGLVDDLSASLDSTEARVTRVINDIKNQITSQVNTMLDSLDIKLNEQIGVVFDDVKNQIGSNKFINRINSLASKFNKVLDNANELLEVSLLYEKNGSFRPMSASKGIPSVYNASEIELYPTSLTADILAPAYKRFVAVTNVIDYNTGANAQDDGGVYQTALVNANQNSTNMCQVIEPNQSVTFKPQGDYIYEIVYSAIDFQGYISTRRFYIRAK